jgi:hypothetical protein
MLKILITAYRSYVATKKTVFMLTAFFDMEETLQSEFVPLGQTINSAFHKEFLYVEVMRHHDGIRISCYSASETHHWVQSVSY